jgi:hypothetical protein
MVEAPARPRLPPVQRVLVAALGVLIITVQVALVFAYRNPGKTTVTYGTATDVVTGLARVQRATLELAIELERASASPTGWTSWPCVVACWTSRSRSHSGPCRQAGLSGRVSNGRAKELYDVSESTFFGSIDDALRACTNLERVLIGTRGAILAVALTLALSLRRRANRAFAHAYRRLVQEGQQTRGGREGSSRERAALPRAGA